jgi:hypothetical protein
MINEKNQLERVWKKADVTSFEVLSRSLPGGTEETTKNFTVRIVNLRAEI